MFQPEYNSKKAYRRFKRQVWGTLASGAYGFFGAIKLAFHFRKLHKMREEARRAFNTPAWAK